MRQLRLALAMIAAAPAVLPMAAQQTRLSPHETVSAVLGDRHAGDRVTITYGRPYLKDPRTGQLRKVWGSLVPWDSAYRLGADEATLIVTQQPLIIGEATVPAGAYTLYLVPSEKGASKLAISTAIGKWGVPVDETHDLARVDVKREALAAPVDQLTIAIDKNSEGGGVLRIMWDDTQFSAPLRLPAPHLEFPQASPTATLKQHVGLTDIEVVYSRPSAKGRVMIGGNNPYGQVWRTGANSATRITFSTPVTIEGKPLDSGTYELFTIPGRDQWTVILQAAQHQWGAYAYDAKNDALRVDVKPAWLTEPVETFTIEFNDLRDESATLQLTWEKTCVPVKIGVDVVGVLKPKIDAAMEAPGKKPYAQAALFYLDHNLDLDRAAEWMDKAIAEQPDAFYYLYHKARILAKKGDKAGALAAANQSLAMAKQAKGPENAEYTHLNEVLIDSLK
jgi:hypothetical protein